ncbi:hypothetical protein BDA96_03G183800 [Sorghum bicolor]|uniref:Uncharacterized protein n=2 Tax=Sorghum bicolor TaxID=4558 RepID=A0A921RDH2_SORBI|nr:hypothetical protein BDA96_03G183800 [Sorghum bicolor]OQU77786.1 hypothetical protein SORBI_3009G102550 [Sorghum bicolor]
MNISGKDFEFCMVFFSLHSDQGQPSSTPSTPILLYPLKVPRR